MEGRLLHQVWNQRLARSFERGGGVSLTDLVRDPDLQGVESEPRRDAVSCDHFVHFVQLLQSCFGKCLWVEVSVRTVFEDKDPTGISGLEESASEAIAKI